VGSGLPIRRRTGAIGPEKRWEENGEELYPSASDSGSGREHYELSLRGPILVGAPAENGFLSSQRSPLLVCRCLQMTANSSPFHPENWGYGNPILILICIYFNSLF